jgi:hypothetical protein
MDEENMMDATQSDYRFGFTATRLGGGGMTHAVEVSLNRNEFRRRKQGPLFKMEWLVLHAKRVCASGKAEEAKRFITDEMQSYKKDGWSVTVPTG